METYIFYSWQSDLPNNTNRGFIEKALTNAIKSIYSDDSILVEPVIDRDTIRVPGSPDIAATIFEKIDRASVFVCDVSFINFGSKGRLTPNPNVLVELGYALKAKGVNRVLMVLNSAYGKIEDLPFDLRFRRIITYHIETTSSDKATERKQLERMLLGALRSILENVPEPNAVSVDVANPYALKLNLTEGFMSPIYGGRTDWDSTDPLLQVEVMNIGSMPSYVGGVSIKAQVDSETKYMHMLNLGGMIDQRIWDLLFPIKQNPIEPGRKLTFSFPYSILRRMKTQGNVVIPLDVVVRDEIGNSYTVPLSEKHQNKIMYG